MLRQHCSAARVLSKRRVKQELSGFENENKQKDRTLELGETRKLPNAGNRDIDTIMQGNCDTSPAKMSYDRSCPSGEVGAQGQLWASEYKGFHWTIMKLSNAPSTGRNHR